MIITLTTAENQKNNTNNNITTINLGECEFELRKFYNLSNNETLYIKKIDVKQEGMKIPKIEYDIYCKFSGSYLRKLNLSVCENTKIDLFIPVEISENVDKLNSSSDYYNDICYTATSDTGTDISLKDRKKEFIEGNKTVCQDDCDFSLYDNQTKKAKCSCKVQETSLSIANINIDREKLYKNFVDFKNIANFNLLVCYNNLFTNQSILKNVGSYIIILIALLNIITFFIFHISQFKIIKKKINILINELSDFNFVKFEKKGKIKKIKKKENINEINNNKNNSRNKMLLSLNNNTLKKIGTNKSIINRRQENKNKTKNIKSIKIDNNKKNFNNDKNNIKRSNNFTKANNKAKNKNRNFSRIETNKGKRAIKSNLIKQNNFGKIKNVRKFIDDEMNDLPYELALQYDKRTYFQYYISLLKTKHDFIFSFCNNNDYNSKVIKISLFFTGFTIYYIVNALFFNDDTMHNIYENKGSFDLEYQLPKIIYSSLISTALNKPLNFLALSNNNIISFKQDKNKKNAKERGIHLQKILTIKFVLYFIISFIFLLFFLVLYSNVWSYI